MVFLVRKMRTLARLKQFKIVVVTDRTDLEELLRETASLSGETVRPTDTEARCRCATTSCSGTSLNHLRFSRARALVTQLHYAFAKSRRKVCRCLPMPEPRWFTMGPTGIKQAWGTSNGVKHRPRNHADPCGFQF